MTTSTRTTRYATIRAGRVVGWDHASYTEAELWLLAYVPTEYQSEYRITPIQVEDPDDEC